MAFIAVLVISAVVFGTLFTVAACIDRRARIAHKAGAHKRNTSPRYGCCTREV